MAREYNVILKKPMDPDPGMVPGIDSEMVTVTVLITSIKEK